MAWLGKFKLGRPGIETLMEVNPSAMTFDDRKLVDEQRAVDGSLTAVTLSRSRPVMMINGNYITPGMLNQLRALMMIDDTFLIFEPSGFDLTGAAPEAPVNFPNGQVFETWETRVVPSTLTTLVLPTSSWTRADQLRAAASATPTIRIVSVADAYAVAANGFGRVGTGERFDINGVNAYSQNFEALAAGDLAGQVDNGQTWTKISGGGGDTVVVNTVSPIDGTKDIVINGIPVYRRLFGFSLGSFRDSFKIAATSGVSNSQGTLAFANGSDAFNTNMGIFINWNLLSNGFQVTLNVTLVGDPQGTVTYTVTVTPGLFHTVSYEFFNGVFAISLDGALVGRHRSSVYVMDRMFVGNLVASANAPHLDDFSVQSTSGSFDHPSSTITLDTALPDLTPRFVTLQASAMACNIKGIPGKTEGGWVDIWKYDVALEGA